MELRALPVESQTYSEGEPPQLKIAFMVNRQPPRRKPELAAEHEVVGVPSYGVIWIGVVAVAHDKAVDAGGEEGYRGIHAAVAPESEQAGQPAVFSRLRPACHEIAGECPFAAFLPEGEIWIGGEILIQHHVVVEILHAEDRRKGDVAELVFYRETVDK